MPFQPFNVITQAVLNEGTGIAASLRKAKEGPARLQLILRKSAMEKLGWRPGDRLAVLMGDGDQHGLVRLKPDHKGSAELSQHKSAHDGLWYRIGLGPVAQFVNRAEERRWCQWDVLTDPGEEGWIEIVLPRWADETRPSVKPLERATDGLRLAAAVRLPADPRPPRDRLPGDPPPGRSALDQRGKEPRELTRGEARRIAEVLERPEVDAKLQATRAANQLTEERLGQLVQTFGLSRTEARYLDALMDGKLHTKDNLLEVAHDESDFIELKSVDVYVHKLRKKLFPHLIEINTVRATGYQMGPPAIQRARALLEKAEAA